LCDAGVKPADAGGRFDASAAETDGGELAPVPALDVDEGVLEGSGVFCSASNRAGSGLTLVAMLGLGVTAVARRVRRRREEEL
jgi:hypothetical protein